MITLLKMNLLDCNNHKFFINNHRDTRDFVVKIIKEFNIFINVNHNGCFSEGEVEYIHSVLKEKGNIKNIGSFMVDGTGNHILGTSTTYDARNFFGKIDNEDNDKCMEINVNSVYSGFNRSQYFIEIYNQLDMFISSYNYVDKNCYYYIHKKSYKDKELMKYIEQSLEKQNA